MSKQQSITKFLLNKRKLNENEFINDKKLCSRTDIAKTNDDVPDSNHISNINHENNDCQKRIVAGGHLSMKWYQIFRDEFDKKYFKNLEDFLQNERKMHTIYPPENQIFSWSFYCDINQIKVIILGQDPYHGPRQANGLAFSVERDVLKPPSLINIFKEIKNEYSEFRIPQHGDLKQWARQGVLLLNATLTVRKNQPNSHSNHGWEQFTDSIIKYINQNFSNRVFILWGSYAQKKGSIINGDKHLILKSVHPSPLSAMRGFFGCNHFRKANDYLIKNGIEPIDWTKLD